jgi:hypothetical protein
VLIKLNVVAFHRPIHDDSLTQERPHPWVETVPHQDLLDAYKEWGNDAQIILEHVTEPSRWSIHTLYPPLKSYVKGNIVLAGDAVSWCIGFYATLLKFIQIWILQRPTECFPILELVLDKDSKTYTSYIDF